MLHDLNQMKHILSHPISKILFIIMAILFIISLQLKKKEIARRALIIEIQQTKVEKLKQEISDLESKASSSADPFFQEKIVRNELLMQKEGETIIQIPPELLPTRIIPSPTPSFTPWQAWKELL